LITRRSAAVLAATAVALAALHAVLVHPVHGFLLSDTSGYLAMAGTAAVIGPFAALVSWLLVGDRVPIFVDQVTTIDVPRWPTLPAFGAAWLTASLVLALIAVLARFARRVS